MKRCRKGGERQRFHGIWYRMVGLSIAETCHLLQISRGTLREWVKLWNRGGSEQLWTELRSGRPRKLDVEAQDIVIKEIEGRLADGTPYNAILIHGYLKKKT
ncbi:MAG: helix-turn-helix domain-containing protein [Pseudomonadota bacterium]